MAMSPPTNGSQIMQQLSGMDGMFLSVDTSTSSGVMGGMIVYERPDDPEAGSRARMIDRITERIDHVPPLRWVLTRVPLHLDKEYWAENHVDVPAHVTSYTVDGEGTDRDLAALVSELMIQPMDKLRPLWDLAVIDGLEGGRIAHLLRIHHGVIDGSSVPLVLDLLSDNPTVEPHPADRPRLGHEPGLGKAEMLARGVVGSAIRPVRFLGLQLETAKFLARRVPVEGTLVLPAFVARMIPGALGAPLRGVINLRQRLWRKPAVRPILPQLRKPATPFNKTITAKRTFAFSDMPLGEVKALGKAYGVSLNDIVVAICAGALRRYLEDNGGIPDEPLVVCVPYSLRTGEEKHRWANHISMFFAPLPTHLADPVARVTAVHDDLLAARENFDALPKDLMRDAYRFIPHAVFSVAQQLLSKAPDWVSGSSWNVVVSNVRGPSHTVEVTGARMTGYWPAAFLTTGVGLNITLQSYRDRINFGFMGAADLTGDLWELASYMNEALAELEAAAPTALRPARSAQATAAAQTTATA
jgi:diacylglycerol O-acyltransferase